MYDKALGQNKINPSEKEKHDERRMKGKKEMNDRRGGRRRRRQEEEREARANWSQTGTTTLHVQARNVRNRSVAL